MKKRIFAVAACVVILVMSIIPISAAAGYNNGYTSIIPFRQIIITDTTAFPTGYDGNQTIFDIIIDFPQTQITTETMITIPNMTYINNDGIRELAWIKLDPAPNITDEKNGIAIRLPRSLTTSTSKIKIKADPFVITEENYKEHDFFSMDTIEVKWAENQNVYTTAQASAITPSAIETFIEEKGNVWNTAALRLETIDIETEIEFNSSLDIEPAFPNIENLSFNWNWINVNTGEVVQENNFIFGTNIKTFLVENFEVQIPISMGLGRATNEPVHYVDFYYKTWWKGYITDIKDFYSNNLGEGTFLPWTYGSGNDQTYYLERSDWNIDIEPFNLADFISTSIGGIFEPNIFGLFSLGDLMLTVIAIGVIFAVLKYFAGG